LDSWIAQVRKWDIQARAREIFSPRFSENMRQAMEILKAVFPLLTG
jgi:hypothetical protein